MPMEEYLMSISLMGFGSIISMMIYQARKNDSLIRNLCERISRLEGIISERLKDD